MAKPDMLRVLSLSFTRGDSRTHACAKTSLTAGCIRRSSWANLLSFVISISFHPGLCSFLISHKVQQSLTHKPQARYWLVRCAGYLEKADRRADESAGRYPPYGNCAGQHPADNFAALHASMRPLYFCMMP